MKETHFSIMTLLNNGFKVERDGGVEYLATPMPTERGILVTQDFENISEIPFKYHVANVYVLGEPETVDNRLTWEEVVSLVV